MRISAIRVFLIGATCICCACEKDSPTKPRLPVIGTGFVLSSTRDLPISEIYSMRSDGSGLARLTNDSLQDSEPRWSPDGKRIAYIHAHKPGGYEPNISIMNSDGSNRTRLITDAGDANPSWSPDGLRIAFERNTSLFPRNQLWIVNADGSAPTLVVDSLEAREITWTSQNTFLGIDGFGIVQFNVDGSGTARIVSLTPGTVSNAYPQMSPDGVRIVFQWTGPAGSEPQIYVVNTDGTDLHAITNTSGAKSYPIWSSDGSKIAFTSYQDGTISVWTMDSDGGNQVRVSPSPGGDQLGDWR